MRTGLIGTAAKDSFNNNRKRNHRVVARIALLTSAAVSSAIVSQALAAQFTYTPTSASADNWSAGTNWNATPASATSTELTFVTAGNPVGEGILNTNFDNFTGLFQLNILDLNGVGPTTTASGLNINSSSPATGLQLISNGSTTPVVNLNATAGAAGFTYNINAPITFTNNTNLTGSGTASFNLLGALTGAASTTVQKTGTSTLTIAPSSGTDTFVTLQDNGGTLILGGGTINATSLQITPASGVSAAMNMIGGTVTVTSDYRMQGQGVGTTVFNLSGGTLNLSKVTIGSAAQTNAANNIFTVSGSAVVNQNQTVGSRELWIGGNNAGSGELQLQGNSSWTAGAVSSADAVIGRFGGTGALNIQDSATFTYTGTTLDVADALTSTTSTTGTINLNGGTLAVTGLVQGAGNSPGVSTANFNANGGVIKALAANANFFNGFTTATNKAGAVNLLAGGLNFNTNGFADMIGNVMTGVGGITKQGAGTLTLTGSSSYTGNTSVTTGTLLVNGIQSATSGTPAVSVSAGATLGGTGTIAGSFSHAAGTITGGNVGTIGTLTFAGPVTLNGGTIVFDVNGANVLATGNNSTAGDQIQVNNNLTFGSTPEVINFAFNNSASLPSSFTYKMFGYTGSLAGTPNLTYTSNLGRTQFTTNTGTAGEVDVTVNPLAASLNWNSTSSSVWDVQSTSNWFNTGTNAADIFFNGDNVHFVDNNANSTPPNGQLQTAISLNTSVSPGSVTDSANTNSYTISGSGNINGSGSVSVTGTAPLIIQTNNNYSGGTIINGGSTLQLGDGTTANGNLGSGAVIDNGSLITNYGAAATLASTISGSGSLTKMGSATLSVTGTSNFSGGTTVAAGTLELDGSGSLTGSGTILNSAAIVSTGTNILGGNLTGAGTVTTTGTAILKLTGSNAAFAGTTTINTGTTLQIGNNTSSGTMPGGMLSVLGTLAFDRSDTFTLTSPLAINAPLGINATVSQVGPVGSNLILTGTNTITNLNVGFNSAAGSLTVPIGASLAVGNNGTGALNVGVSPNVTGSVLAKGTLDASQASSFTANVATIAVGTTGNQSVTAFGNLYLPATTNIIATTSFLVGDSAGAQNGNILNSGTNGSSGLTTGAGGTTNVSTPVFSIGQTKSSATFILGPAEKLNVSGIGGRTLMSVGNILTGGGSGIYVDSADLSAGTVNLMLSGLDVGVNGNNSGSGSAEIVATMHIGSSVSNHLDVSGPSVGGTGDSGVVNIGCEITNSTNPQTGTLTIDFLDSSSQITSTNNGTAILVGGALAAGNSNGTLNLNGGTLMITTTGSAIASDTNAVAGFTTSGTATVNFNGITLIAGANSSTWIQNLTLADGVTSGANLLAGGLTINTNGFNITVPQQFVSSGSDGGITKTGTGTLTLTAGIPINSVNNPASTYNGPTNVLNGTLLIPAGASTPSGSTVTAGALTSGATPILAGTGIIGGPAFVLGSGSNASAGHIAPGMTGATLGTLSFANGLTFNPGSNADFRLGVASGSIIATAGFSSLIAVTSGALTLPTGTGGSSPGNVVVNLTDDANAGGQGSIGSGTYELFSFSTLTNAFDPSEFTIGTTPLAAGSTYTFTEVGGNQIDLTISAVAGPQNLIWSGGTAAWDIATTPNWNSNTTQFNQLDNVTFDDSNTGSLTVTMNTTVTPGSVTVNTTKAYIFNGTAGIGGSTGVNLSGGGSLTMQNSNSYTGATNVSGSGTTLNLASTGKLATQSLAIGTGSVANITGLLTGTPSVTVNGTMTFGANATDGTNGTAGTILNRSIGALNVTGTLNLAGTTLANQSSRTLLITSSLTNTGKIDLANNDMIVHNGSAGSVSTAGSIANQLAMGYSGGTWNGATGIVSSTAFANASHLTALGTRPGGVTFDGVSTTSTDVLVKYTYYGDATLDGVVDGSDYSRIDSGFMAAVTGWFNGDFNYDGVINGSDYTLIDNAFNSQGVSLAAEVAAPTAQIAGTSAVPEPATLGLMGVAALGLLGRRRRY